ncbi:hypothetical protein NMY22_g905 [Coprinellus aureogranulatus]|nr:hypothetical protein NMY22_g905 [Coprinellus aureogranulatus]
MDPAGLRHRCQELAKAIPCYPRGPSSRNRLSGQVFEEAIKRFHQQRNFVGDYASLVIDGRPVDLWALHKVVLEMGGFSKVEANGMWDIVGGKLGFVNFPGSDGQPPRSGPGTSLQITQYYKDYVQAFDAAYVRSMLENRQKASSGGLELSEQQRQQLHMMVKSVTGVDLNNMTRAQPAGAQNGMINPELQRQLVSYAHRTVQELRNMGVPDPVIAKVEAMRPNLQRMAQDQVNFKGMGRNGNVGMQPGQQPFMTNGNAGPSGMGGRSLQPPFGGAAGGVPGQVPGPQAKLAQGGMPNAAANFMGQQMGGPSLPHHQQPGPSHPQRMALPGQLQGKTLPQPSEHLRQALAHLHKIKAEAEEGITRLPHSQCPPEQRAEYNSLLETVATKCNEFEATKLGMMYSMNRNEENARRILTLIATVQRQRTMVSSGSPLIIISLDSLRQAEQDLIKLNNAFVLMLQGRQGQLSKPPQPFMPGHPQPSPMQMTIQQRMAQQQNMSAMLSVRVRCWWWSKAETEE